MAGDEQPYPGIAAAAGTFPQTVKGQTRITYTIHDIVGNSREIELLKEKIKKIAPSDVSVLIWGESGTGKELFAHSIHHLSDRSNKPFVSINCASIPEHLLESELFRR